jgi:C-terminal processing protease CtpA/Prc
MTRALLALALGLLVALVQPAGAAEQGRATYGFKVKVDAATLSLNPVIKSVVVDEVKPGSPAERAGIVPGDEILQAEGRDVPGAKADDVKPLMQRRVGDPLALKLRRADGSVYDAHMVGVARH